MNAEWHDADQQPRQPSPGGRQLPPKEEQWQRRRRGKEHVRDDGDALGNTENVAAAPVGELNAEPYHDHVAEDDIVTSCVQSCLPEAPCDHLRCPHPVLGEEVRRHVRRRCSGEIDDRAERGRHEKLKHRRQHDPGEKVTEVIGGYDST